ncbi:MULTISPECIES: RNA polymerase-binding protein DksA [unclassified Pantoea]|uniref:RNA polymerase-binding protein DksA n=1 Tax=unclassified Pantoea TaxID=2630326 RepID=UPI001CD68BC8|nr:MULTISPECIES: RNA polymerase-binding protein DksA [unclassified Pantoea]MCA1177494.1 RNA polymerase-binding protein DksA [Pantoea sp. alder69]MCA1249600.1 RNA polymerase-binding protein DksA [Pantoea sp. alder70]MCA1265983.1 RNA polymerase-binding protein DksA [Pantoea sp. alder81]
MNKPTAAEQQNLLSMPPDAYMNAHQSDFFLRLLRFERQELLDHIDYLKTQLQRNEQQGDEADKALREEELRLLFRQIDRESRLIPKIAAAMQRIHQGEYGFCRETGDPIGLARLLLRPTAELSIDAKIKQERVEAQYRK